MANIQAIVAVTKAVLELLKSNYNSEDFNNHQAEFKVFLARDFSQPMPAGVSLFLYRVLLNGSHRTPAGRSGQNGQRYIPQLPLDLHFLLTAWGQDHSFQHAMVGWMMRLLEDTPIMSAAFINAVSPGVFRTKEAVEISLTELKTEDLVHIWDTLVQNQYQLSIPYVARNIQIESTRFIEDGPLVQERRFKYYRHPSHTH